jgi:hypothetical protein
MYQWYLIYDPFNYFWKNYNFQTFQISHIKNCIFFYECSLLFILSMILNLWIKSVNFNFLSSSKTHLFKDVRNPKLWIRPRCLFFEFSTSLKGHIFDIFDILFPQFLQQHQWHGWMEEYEKWIRRQSTAQNSPRHNSPRTIHRAHFTVAQFTTVTIHRRHNSPQKKLKFR